MDFIIATAFALGAIGVLTWLFFREKAIEQIRSGS
jgi:hypothetical protein